MAHTADVAVIGAGIMGLAFADVAARDGRKVVLFERDDRAFGASVRNFGMIWPIGQRPGRLYQIAMRSRHRWVELAREAGFRADECGSLHLAHQEDEFQVLREFEAASHELDIECYLLDEDETREKSPAVRTDELYGSLYSPWELCVDPREALGAIPAYLYRSMGVEPFFGTVVTSVKSGEVRAANGETWHVGRVIVAGGTDMRTLYPDVYANSGIRPCKLQMMRTRPQPDSWRLGVMVAGGLTLLHYPNFQVCPTLEKLERRIRETMPEFVRLGIHVMAAHNGSGEVVIGDSHEYGDEITPFDRTVINEMILGYLNKMVDLPSWTIAETWHGLYAKHPTEPIFVNEPEPGVHLVNAPGGAGMTMAFGWAAELWPRWV